MKVHFIAIGGAVMHNLAIALHLKGEEVSGSDDEIFEPSKSRLDSYGLLPPSFGWHPEKITEDLDYIILGMHAKQDNPELIKAKELNIPILSFPEFLYQESKDKKRVVIAGSHGKTTTTAMILHVLNKMNIKADYMVGAMLKGFDVMVKLSKNAEVIILEGDEYLTSPLDRRPKFVHYKPHIAILNGIEWDHMNVFPTKDIYLDQFQMLLDGMEDNGKLFYYNNDEMIKTLISSNRSEAYHPYTNCNYKKLNDSFSAIGSDGREYSMQVFGEHNFQNMEAARLVCRELGVNEDDFFRSISSFEGASGRLETLTNNDKLSVYKDFAHAPSKVKATVKAVRELHPERKLIACFELHTYSSLNKDFLPEYKETLDAADEAYVYFNPEAIKLKRLDDLFPADIEKAFRHQKLKVFSNTDDLFRTIQNECSENTALLLMSSGNFNNVSLVNLTEELLNNI